MKSPDAKAAVDKNWEKLEKLPSWPLTKVKSNKEVILEAQKQQRTVHFATLMESTKAGSCSEVTLSKTIQAHTLYSQNRVRLHLK